MWSFGLLGFLAGCIETGVERVKEAPPEGDRVLSADPILVDFGVLSTSSAVTETVTVTAVGELPVTVSGIDVTGSSAYTLAWASDGTVIEPGDAVDLVVTYTPLSMDDAGELLIHSDAVDPTLVVPLQGAGTYPALTISPSAVTFLSEYGETVETEVVVTSVGTADLYLSDIYVEGAWFSADSAIPISLAPGESTTLDVRYTPEVAGEHAIGKVWLTTNTAAGFAIVPLDAFWGTPCVGLGEAWDRGLLTVETLFNGSTLSATNLSTDEDLCIDGWYVFLSDESQDLGAGDMDGDFADDYPNGSMEIPVEEVLDYRSAATSDAAWWCMEETQTTDRNKDYTFTGGYVPEPLLSYMYAEDQDAVWAWMAANPVMIAARGTNYVEVPAGGGAASVTLRVVNMGGVEGTSVVRESVPAGWSASDFSVAPDRTEVGSEGATVYVWDLTLDARVETPLDEQTIYDEASVTYQLTVPACRARQYVDELTSTWVDSESVSRVASANPLVVNCVE